MKIKFKRNEPGVLSGALPILLGAICIFKNNLNIPIITHYLLMLTV